MFWNTKFRWVFIVVIGFGFIIGLSRCSPIAPNLSKGDYQKNPRFANTPPSASISKIHVLRYSSRMVNADEKDVSADAKTAGVTGDGLFEAIKLSEESAGNVKDQFLKFKSTGRTELVFSNANLNSDPVRIPTAVQGVFALDTFQFEKYFDFLDFSDVFFLSSYYGAETLEEFSSIVTELNPNSESGSGWILEIAHGTNAEFAQKFQNRLESIRLLLSWKN